MDNCKPKRTYVATVYERNGVTFTLPYPYKYREALDLIHLLEIRPDDNEKEIKVIGYKSLFVPEPNLEMLDSEVRSTAKALSELPENQVREIGHFCEVFNLDFSDIPDILHLLNNVQEDF